MNKKETALLAVAELEKLYPEAKCSLIYTASYELMIAARLSAQCTDARVNIVTNNLFRKYSTLQSFSEADLAELENDVKPCGFYRTKAKSIKEMAAKLFKDFSGEIPKTMDDLLTLPGIGRKTANLIMGDVWGKPAIVTDTHFIRITGRLGLTSNTEPSKVEKDLIKLIPPEKSSDFCHRIVEFGRDICSARKPLSTQCPMNYFCKSVNINTQNAQKL